MTMNVPIQEYIKDKMLLAPMAGTTDIAFRTICKEFGAAMTHTEMVSARGISIGSTYSARCAVFDSSEHPIAIQIFSSTPDLIRRAIDEVQIYKPDVIDINAGCPSEQVCKLGAGAALLDNLSSLSRLINSAVQSTSIPVSVKVRTGPSPQKSIIKEIAKIVEYAGAVYLTVHARTRHTRYDQPAQWRWIAEAKQCVSIPVVGNGDIFSAHDAIRMLNETDCDAVLVARGSLGTPWIFRDYIRLKSGERIDDILTSEMKETVIRHIQLLKKNLGDFAALPRIRKNICWYTRYFHHAGSLRDRIFQTDNVEVIQEHVRELFDSEPIRYSSESPEYRAIEEAFRRRVLFWMQDYLFEEV